jgi:hypothetical protein
VVLNWPGPFNGQLRGPGESVTDSATVAALGSYLHPFQCCNRQLTNARMQVVQDKHNLGVLSEVTTLKYAFGTALQAEDLRIVMNTTINITSGYTTAQPYVQCSFYNAIGTRTEVTCTLSNYTACAEPGEQNCMLHTALNSSSIHDEQDRMVTLRHTCSNSWLAFTIKPTGARLINYNIS